MSRRAGSRCNAAPNAVSSDTDKLRIARIGHQAGDFQRCRRRDDLAGVVIRLAIEGRFEFRQRAEAFFVQFVDQRIAADVFGNGVSVE